MDRFIDANPEVNVVAPLIEADLNKADCLELLRRAGIELPVMYALGYSNNNCIGCVKGGAGYWNKIRVDFPARFAEMAGLERELDRKICKYRGERVFLDELPPSAGNRITDMPESCSFACEMPDIADALKASGVDNVAPESPDDWFEGAMRGG